MGYVWALLLMLSVSLSATAQEGSPTISVEEKPDTIRITSSVKIVSPLQAAFALPLKCAPDGTIVARFAVGGAMGDPTALRSDGTTIRFGGESVPGGFDARAASFFPSPDSMFVLFRMMESPRQEKFKGVTSRGETVESTGMVGTRRDVIAEFDWNGKFRSSTVLDLPFLPLQFGAFSSGYFVVAGVEDSTNEPRVALIRPNGQLDRYLQLLDDVGPDTPVAAKDSSDKRQTQFTSSHNTPALVLYSSDVASDQGNVLLVRRHSSAPVFEISPGGAVRAVRLHAPNGSDLLSLTPVPRGWLAVFTKDLVTSRGMSAQALLLDRTDGHILQSYAASTFVGLGWGCPLGRDDFSFIRRNPDNSTEVAVRQAAAGDHSMIVHRVDAEIVCPYCLSTEVGYVAVSLTGTVTSPNFLPSARR